MANASWTLSSKVPSSGCFRGLHQGRVAVLPSVSFALVTGMATAGFHVHVPVGPQGIKNRGHGLLFIFGPQTPAQVCTHSITQPIFDVKFNSLSPVLVHNLWTAPPSFHSSVTGKPCMLLWCWQLQPHGSAWGWNSGWACSPELCNIWELIYTSLNQVFWHFKKLNFSHSYNKWLSCAQEFKVYVLGGQERVMKRTWPSVSAHR